MNDELTPADSVGCSAGQFSKSAEVAHPQFISVDVLKTNPRYTFPLMRSTRR